MKDFLITLRIDGDKPNEWKKLNEEMGRHGFSHVIPEGLRWKKFKLFTNQYYAEFEEMQDVYNSVENIISTANSANKEFSIFEFTDMVKYPFSK